MLELKLTLHLIKSVSKDDFRSSVSSRNDPHSNLSELHDYFNEKYLYAEIFEGKNINGSDEVTKLKFNVKDGGNIYRNIVEGVPDRLEVEAVGLKLLVNFMTILKHFISLKMAIKMCIT